MTLVRPPVTDADVKRLIAEREDADRRYNDTLTELDASLMAPRDFPSPVPAPPGDRLEELNRLWKIVPDAGIAMGGWRGRLAAFVWRVVAPLLQRQQAFNAALVDQLNRDAATAAKARETAARLTESLSQESAALVRFQSLLSRYLQEITLYVDTKDRLEFGLLQHRTAALAGGLSGLADELLKRWESARTREGRFEARVEEMRIRLAAFERTTEALGRELARLGAEGVAVRANDELPIGWVPPPPQVLSETAVRQALAAQDDSAIYAGFEDKYRGSVTEVRERLSEYLPLFTGASDVLDLGCGRGEFLEALRENGITSRGVDLNPEMVSRCRALGLDVVRADALEYLAGLPDGSLGGLFAAQVIEHLQPDRLLRLLGLARAKLRPGARIVLETVNPACWAAFFSSYIRDITHVRPIHPDTLHYLLAASGFHGVDIRYSSPCPRESKLQSLSLTLRTGAPGLAEVLDGFNGNVEKLNALLFTYFDYAAIGERA
ncbi:MAG TPA: methyltransferase domain-containing protein [Vicinamibacterales bacterium]